MNIKDILTDLGAVCGVALIGLGLWQIYQPAAFIGVGCIMLVASIKAAKQ